MKVKFNVPCRIANIGWNIEDFCKFYSYLFLYKNYLSFSFYRENNCEVCGSNKKLIIHHIVPFTNFGLHKESNLIILCKDCHYKVHYKDLKLIKKGKFDFIWYGEYKQLLELSKRFDYINGNNNFKIEVIDKILLLEEMLNLPLSKREHIDLKEIIIKTPINSDTSKEQLQGETIKDVV